MNVLCCIASLLPDSLFVLTYPYRHLRLVLRSAMPSCLARRRDPPNITNAELGPPYANYTSVSIIQDECYHNMRFRNRVVKNIRELLIASAVTRSSEWRNGISSRFNWRWKQFGTSCFAVSAALRNEQWTCILTRYLLQLWCMISAEDM